MKHVVEVTRVFLIELDIDDSILSDKHLEDFSSYMFPVDKTGMIKYIASCVAEDINLDYIEGVGDATYYDKNRKNMVQYNVAKEATEAEIL